MQIYYCDACGIRVNNSELTPGGDKVFCQACAAKQNPTPAAPPRRSPSGGIVLPQRPKTDGSAIPTPLRGTSATARPPSPAFGSGQSIPVQRGNANASGERPRTGNTGTIHRPASASARSTTAKPNDPTLIYAGAGAGAMLLLVLVFFVMRSGSDSAPESKAPPKSEVKPPVSVAPPVVTPPTSIEQPQPPPDPPKSNDLAIDDIRERAARREYESVQRKVRDAGNDILAARRLIQDFIRRYRTTQAGQEALAQATKMAQVHARPADVPSAPQPGLKLQVFERPGDWEEIRNRNLASLKKLKDLTLDKIDMPNRKAVESTFGRPEYVAAIVTGYIEVPADGEYYLAVNSDDASFLFVGDWRVSENDGSHAVSEAGDTVPLKKGKHRIRILYSQGQGEATLQFYWSGPGISKQIVPPQALSHDP